MGRTKPTIVKLEPEVKYDILKSEIEAEFPDFEIRRKADFALMKAINIFLVIVSFGQAREFMTKFSTTLGNKIYVNDSWEGMSADSRMILLRHERVHMRQAKKYGRIIFSFLYLFVFFPIGLSYFRAKFEKEAYEESIRAEVELRGINRVLTPEYQNWLAGQFFGPGYLYSWPFRNHIYRWIRKSIDTSIAEYLSKNALSPVGLCVFRFLYEPSHDCLRCCLPSLFTHLYLLLCSRGEKVRGGPANVCPHCRSPEESRKPKGSG